MKTLGHIVNIRARERNSSKSPGCVSRSNLAVAGQKPNAWSRIILIVLE
jgi:hypothetical protein